MPNLHPVVSKKIINGLEVTELAKETDIQGLYHSHGKQWWENPDCPHSYQYGSLDTLYNHEYYSGLASHHPDEKKSAELYDYMQDVYSRIFRQKFFSVLELGGGAGDLTEQFKKHDLIYMVVEGTAAGAAHLIKKGIPNLCVINENVKFMDKSPGLFDLVMCTEIIEHIEPFFASKVVEVCYKSSDVVWFSSTDGAGTSPHYHHCNEQKIEAWDNLFAHMGFTFSIPLKKLHDRADRLYIKEAKGKSL